MLSPIILVEVLSPSTGDFDRAARRICIARWPQCRITSLLAQDRVLVQRYARQPGQKWLLETFESLDAVLRLESIGVDVPLSEICARVDFDSAE